MRVIALLALTIWACSAPRPSPPASTVVYVATTGNDQWTGLVAEANAARTDGPFATLPRARDEVRRLLAANRSARVMIRAGTYELSEPLQLSREDSGRAANPVVWSAFPGEVVQVVGSRRLPAPTAVLTSSVSLPGAVRTTSAAGLPIRDYGSPGGGGVELFEGGVPLVLARWPNNGFSHIASVSADAPVEVRGHRGSAIGRFTYEGERPARWTSERDIWVHGYWFWDWAESRSKVQEVVPASHEISLAPPYHPYGYRAGQWFYAYNVLAELDEPGEWFLDRTTGQLFVWPLSNAELRLSILPSLIDLRDASFIRFEGLDLGEVRGDVVRVHGGQEIALERCRIRNAGGWAVVVDGGTKHSVVASEVSGTGAGGISIRGGDRRTLTPGEHVIRGNDIHDFSRWLRTRNPGINLDGVGNRVESNRIHDAPHQAIWFHGNDHLIVRNDISNVCRETIDAGAIYAGRDWTMRGTQIRENYLHDLHGLDGKGCVGIYLDDMFSGTQITQNIMRNVDSAILIGGGRDNVVANNLLVDCRIGITVDARALGWAASSLETLRRGLTQVPTESVVWRRRYPELANLLDTEPGAPVGTVVERNGTLRCPLDSIETMARRYIRQGQNFIGVDPGFVDFDHGDLRLRTDSELVRAGFATIPFERIGPKP